jgi:hypothetical protein
VRTAILIDPGASRRAHQNLISDWLPFAVHFGLVDPERIALARFARAWDDSFPNVKGWPQRDDPWHRKQDDTIDIENSATSRGTPENGEVGDSRYRRGDAPGRSGLFMMDETLAEAALCTSDFTEPERRYQAALAAAARDGDRKAEARATGDLGIMHHYRNISQLLDGEAIDEAAIAAEETLMHRALDLWRSAKDDAGTATAMFGAGLVH